MKYWIWLSTLPYIGTVSARKIITVLKNPKNVYYSSEEELRKIGNLTLRQRNSILMNRELENAKRIIEQCEKHRISLLPIENPLYPKRAGNCNDAPIILYYKGTIQRMDKTVATELRMRLEKFVRDAGINYVSLKYENSQVTICDS